MSMCVHWFLYVNNIWGRKNFPIHFWVYFVTPETPFKNWLWLILDDFKYGNLLRFLRNPWNCQGYWSSMAYQSMASYAWSVPAWPMSVSDLAFQQFLADDAGFSKLTNMFFGGVYIHVDVCFVYSTYTHTYIWGHILLIPLRVFVPIVCIYIYICVYVHSCKYTFLCVYF